MSSPRPDRQLECGILVRQERAGVRYILPHRNLTNARKAGIGLMIFGCIFTAFMIFWMSVPISSGIRTESDSIGRWLSIGFGLLGLPGLAVGLGLMLLGIVILRNAGHSEILVTDGQVLGIERLGPLSLKWKRRLDRVTRFVVSDNPTFTNSTGRSFTPAPDVSALRVESTSGRPMWMAIAYPRATVKALADELAAVSAGLLVSGGRMRETLPPIPVVDEAAEVEADLPVEKPAGSRVFLRELDNGFAVVVPPAGLLKGSKGLFFFSLMWNGFMVVFTTAMVFGASKDGGSGLLALGAFLSVFWAIGIGVLLGAINMGRRQTMLAVTAGTFAVQRKGLFGVKETRLPADEIAAARMGPSGAEVNDKAIMELQVMKRDGKKIGLLSELREDELKWLAWLLRSRLHVGR